MELLFRRHFWIFHVVFLTVTAYLVAHAVTTGVGAILKGVLDGGAVAVDQKKAAPRGRTRNFNVATDANIFGAKREVVSEQAVTEKTCTTTKDCPEGSSCKEGICQEGAGDPKNDLASAVPTELRARLVGTAVFSEAEYSLASIVDESGGKGSEAELYSVNPCAKSSAPADAGPYHDPQAAPCNQLLEVAEVRLIDVNRVYVYNKTEERFEYLELGAELKGGSGVATRAPREEKPKEGKGENADELAEFINKTGDNAYEVKQEGVDKALGDLSRLATQARIVPAFEGGEAVGFKLFSIRPGSLYSKIGIQNGDVISRINGYEINSPDKALEVYQKLKDAKEITVDMKRRGKPMTLSYNITP